MTNATIQGIPEPYSIISPVQQTLPFVLNSPHSGRAYLPEFLMQTKLSSTSIRKSEDFLVDKLIEQAVDLGLPLLVANYPRAYIDVNREPYELDPLMFDAPLPGYVNTGSARVAGGLGTIPRVVAEGEEIYTDPISANDANKRIDDIYKPYHKALRSLLARTHLKFGYVVLVDCHSMPSVSNGFSGNRRPEFVLGDRYATSCNPNITHQARVLLQDMGYSVAINKPYAGGFITEHYGRPNCGLHSIQIEINRALYMDEVTIEPSSDFDRFAGDLVTFISRLIKIDSSELSGSFPLAAE